MTTEEFKTFLAPLYRRMYAVAMAILGDADEAADAVQDSAMRLFEMRRRLGAGGDVPKPEAFAVFVVRNAALDRLRELSRKRRSSVDVADIADELSAEAAAQIPDAERIRPLLDSLIPRQREVLLMSTVGGMDAAEVAAELHISEPNVRQLLCRARKKLRMLFDNTTNKS